MAAWTRSGAFRRSQKAKDAGKRSDLEVAVCEAFDKAGVAYEYETLRVPYTPKKKRFYRPDLILQNGIVLELKGRFLTSDRSKHLSVQEDNPDLDVRFVFSNPDTKIGSKSKTTYGMWAKSHGFKYCAAKAFPPAWLREPANVASLAAIARLRNAERQKQK